MCVCIKLETPPFVCIFDGSRFAVSQGCGGGGGAAGGAGTFLRVTAGQGLLFLCAQLPWRSRPPLPHRPHPGMWRLGVDLKWILGGWGSGVINAQHLGCCGCGVVVPVSFCLFCIVQVNGEFFSLSRFPQSC